MNNKKKLMIAVICCLLIAGTGIAVWFFSWTTTSMATVNSDGGFTTVEWSDFALDTTNGADSGSSIASVTFSGSDICANITEKIINFNDVIDECTDYINDCQADIYYNGTPIVEGDIISITAGNSMELNFSVSCLARSCPMTIDASTSLEEVECIIQEILRNTFIYSADKPGNTIYKVDYTGTTQDSFAHVGTSLTGLAYDVDGDKLYSCDDATGLIYRVNMDGSLDTSWTAPANCMGLGVDQLNDRLLMSTNGGGGMIYLLDLADPTIVLDSWVTPDTGANPMGAGFMDTSVWHVDYADGTLVESSIAGALLNSYSICANPSGMDTQGDGGDIVVRCGANLNVYDTTGGLVDSFASAGNRGVACE